jgi:hypothetical protein
VRLTRDHEESSVKSAKEKGNDIVAGDHDIAAHSAVRLVPQNPDRLALVDRLFLRHHLNKLHQRHGDPFDIVLL